jgi:autotransporter-associated beta strand protein
MSTSRIRRTALLIATIVSSVQASHALAEDYFWNGGSGAWATPGNWSPVGVPGVDDRAELRGAAGTVNLGTGVTVRELAFTGTGFTVTGTQLEAAQITAEQGQNTLQIGSIVPVSYLGDLDRAVLEIAGSQNVEPLTVNSPIVNASGFVRNDVYLRGLYTQGIFANGTVQTVWDMRLSGGGGRIFNSTDVRVVNAQLELINDPVGSDDRIPNNANLSLRNASFVLHNSPQIANLVERVGTIELAGGQSDVVVDPDAQLRVTFPGGDTLKRSTTLRPTVQIANEGSVIAAPQGEVLYDVTQHFAPYAMVGGALCYFDYGPDLSPATSDDVGATAVPQTAWQVSNASSHALIDQDWSLANGFDEEVRSFTFDHCTFTIGDFSSLRIGSGAILTRGDTRIAGNAGLLNFINGREAFIHVYYDTATIDAKIQANNGLTKGGYGTLRLNNQNFISGPVTINAGGLILGNVNAVPSTSPIRLVEANLTIDYNGGQIPNRLIFDTGFKTALSGGSFLKDLKVKDGFNFDANNVWEGNGPYFLSGNNSVVRYITTVLPTGSGDMSIWPRAGVTFEVNGNFGNRATGQDGTIILFEGKLAGTGYVTGAQISGGQFTPGQNAGNGIGVFHSTDGIGFFGGTTTFQVTGTARGTAYDAIDAAGFVYFGPDAQYVIPTSGFVGNIGTKLELVRYGAFYAGLTNLNLTNGLGAAPGRQWVWYFSDTALTLAVAGPSGDANLDGRVNFNDLLILAANYNQPIANGWIKGDFNHDGTVNFNDLLVLAANYNTGSLGGLQGDWALALASVPEPTSAVAAVVASGLVLSRRRARRA